SRYPLGGAEIKKPSTKAEPGMDAGTALQGGAALPAALCATCRNEKAQHDGWALYDSVRPRIQSGPGMRSFRNILTDAPSDFTVFELVSPTNVVQQRFSVWNRVHNLAHHHRPAHDGIDWVASIYGDYLSLSNPIAAHATSQSLYL
ncbi:hypothetical protein, partial [Pseudomonas aeruginosa]|uniref:hypothetical protein n=1 Tax=Pseudomonas aeruginosa TaxID=287 RepID=UPI001ABCAFDC